MRDPYEVLGVDRKADEKEIKKAYRRLARDCHPDLHPGDKQAEEKFKEISAAYDLLSDKDKRAAFDRGEIDAEGAPRHDRRSYSQSWGGAGGGTKYRRPEDVFQEFGGDDIFADLFRSAGFGGGRGGMRMKGADASYSLEVDFLDAVKGTTTQVTLPGGKALKVTIPPGSHDGRVLRLKGQGHPGAGEGAPAGDALIELKVKPHPLFHRDGHDIHLELPISLPEAVLGGRIEVPTVDGPVTMTVPKGANTGSRLRLKGKGVPDAKGNRGDAFVTLKVMLPDKPDPELEKLIEAWADKHPYAVRSRQGGTA